MSAVEAEGHTIDEAIETALQRLGVPRDKVEIEILASATRGLFGLGGRKARVRATIRPAIGERVPASSAATAPPRGEPPVGGPEARAVEPARADAATPSVDPRALEHARDVLQKIVRLIGTDAEVGIDEGADGPVLTVTGDESGVLIGRRGQTLDALEYLVNRIVARDEEQAFRIPLDSQNYRARRREALTSLAHRLAAQARRRGKPVTLNPMSPRDRRIVHLALQNTPALSTRSLGTGYFRKLVIVPEGGGRRRSTERR